MSSNEDDKKKRDLNEMFGADSDDESENDDIRPASTGATTADASGLFGSDSESDEEQEEPKKLQRASAPAPPPPKKRIKSSNDSVPSKASSSARDAESRPQTSMDSGDEYDSGDELERTKEDDEFIDKDDDLAHVLKEYDDNQAFDDERPMDEEEERGGQRKGSKHDGGFFEDTLQSLKTRRGNKLSLSVQEMENITQEVLYRMDKAYQDDLTSIAKGQPALEKLKAIDGVLSVIRKMQLQPMFLDFDLLSLVKKWIQPLDDGTLPNLGIRTKMLAMVHRLPIYKEHLKRSGFGKVVMALWKHPEETRENKELCRDMVERWSRSVFNKTLDFSKLAEFEAEKAENAPYRRPERRTNPSPNAAAANKSAEGWDAFRGGQSASDAKTEPESIRARIPKKMRFDFLHRPQPKVDMSTVQSKSKMEADSRKGRLMKRMQEIAKPGKKTKRAVKLSIEGR